MEHIAQMFLVTVFCYTASLHLVSERRGSVLLVVAAFLLPVTRYESLFVVGLVVLLLLVRQRYRVGLLVAFFAVLPVGLYATVSISAGSLAFPNPILLKGVQPNLLDPTITSNVVCGGPTVSFYATSKEDLPALVRHLKNYSRRLPTAVREDGLYMEGR
jgi:hypothetical protein